MADSSDIVATLTKIVHRREDAAIHAVRNQRPRSPSVPNELTPSLVCCGLPTHICKLLLTASPRESTSFFPEAVEEQIELDAVRLLLGRFAATLPHGLVILRRFCSPYSWEKCFADSGSTHSHHEVSHDHLLTDPITVRLPYCDSDDGVDVTLPASMIDGATNGPVVSLRSKHITHKGQNEPEVITSLFVWRTGQEISKEELQTGIPATVKALAIDSGIDIASNPYFDILVYEMWLLHDGLETNVPVSIMSVNINCRSGKFTFSNSELSFSNALRLSVGFGSELESACSEWSENRG